MQNQFLENYRRQLEKTRDYHNRCLARVENSLAEIDALNDHLNAQETYQDQLARVLSDTASDDKQKLERCASLKFKGANSVRANQAG